MRDGGGKGSVVLENKGRVRLLEKALTGWGGPLLGEVGRLRSLVAREKRRGTERPGGPCGPSRGVSIVSLVRSH